MAGFYKPHRNVNWNYGGPNWKLSRSKLDLFISCPRCFYIDNKLGTARPAGFPFNLNSAVDTLLKKEFDIFRLKKQPHTLMQKFSVDAIPYEHPDLDEWRENFKGIQHLHSTGLTVSGAVDDIWINPQGELIVVDYKSTSKDGQVTLDAEWQDGYKRQMEFYQWLLRQKGFKVSNTGYFVYANGRTDLDMFDAKLEFDIDIIPYEGNENWVEQAILDAKACLDGEKIPESGNECEYCQYRTAVEKVTSQ